MNLPNLLPKLASMNPNTFIYLEFLRETLMQLPGVTEKLCYGTPGFYVNKKMFARMKEDGETLVVQSIIREKWMLKDPQTFFITDHYLNYDYMLVNLQRVAPDELISVLLTAWRNRAPQKLVQQYEANNNE
jgi:hypothetical protein